MLNALKSIHPNADPIGWTEDPDLALWYNLPSGTTKLLRQEEACKYPLPETRYYQGIM